MKVIIKQLITALKALDSIADELTEIFIDQAKSESWRIQNSLEEITNNLNILDNPDHLPPSIETKLKNLISKRYINRIINDLIVDETALRCHLWFGHTDVEEDYILEGTEIQTIIIDWENFPNNIKKAKEYIYNQATTEIIQP